MNNPLLQQMDVALLPLHYLLLQLLFLTGLLVALAAIVRRSNRVLYFPSFWLMLGWVLIYLIPSVIFGANIVRGLSDPLFFFGVLYAAPVLVLVWMAFSGRLFVSSNGDGTGMARGMANVGRPIAVLSAGVVGILGVWLSQIPLDCTAGWALIFDPNKTLLAREVTGKLNNAPITSRLIGVYINVLVPLLSFLCGVKISFLIKEAGARAWLKILGLAAWMCFVYLSLLITGAKSTLLPTLIACTVGVALMPVGKLLKLSIAVGLGLFAMLSLVVFQMAIHQSELKQSYQFSSCAVRFDSCDAAKKLISSAATREQPSIAGTRQQARVLWDELSQVCPTKSGDPEFSAVMDEYGNEYGNYIEARSAASGLWVRAFKLPLQVASWYFLWSSGVERPDWRAIPVLSRYLGKANITEVVYQQYGSKYSKGDVTSTSTAPSTFLLTYPSFMGSIGVLFAVMLIILLDCAVALLLRFVEQPVSYGFAGLNAIVAYQLLNTDFFTVLGSHGGLASLVIVSVAAVSMRMRLRDGFNPEKAEQS